MRHAVEEHARDGRETPDVKVAICVRAMVCSVNFYISISLKRLLLTDFQG